MKREFFILPIATIVGFTAIWGLAASEKENADSLERLRAQIERRLPAGWAITIDPSHREPARHFRAESPAIVISSKDKLPIETQMPNPAAGQKPSQEVQRAEIVLTVRPFMTPEQYEQARAMDQKLIDSQVAFARKLEKEMHWSFMGGEPIPPSAFEPKDDRQRRLVLEYALRWNTVESQSQPLPTHSFEGLAFDMAPPLLNSRITDEAKAKEFDDILKTVDGLLTPYEKTARP